jgi:uncharacterized protein YdeI (YjbR/CyaY-like superfamily)
MKQEDARRKVQVQSADELRKWLSRHHTQEDSVWLITFKKSAGDRYVSTSEVLDELVAFGWTDGIRHKVDEERTMQLISPRRTKPWAKTYKDRAEKLIAEGRMHPAGQASIDAAKATGAWEAMQDIDALEIPDDLQAALNDQPTALANFQNFPPSTRRNILRWIAQARTEATRQRRITRIAVDAAANIRTPVNG